MPEEIHSPLLSLIKEQNLIDDLQYEEVAAELMTLGMQDILLQGGLQFR